MEADIVEILESSITPMITAMVDFPNNVNIKIQKSEMKTVFVHITAKKCDAGKIIGKEGRHAGAIRILVSAIGSKSKYRTIVEINGEAD